jgi:hypothetical protein
MAGADFDNDQVEQPILPWWTILVHMVLFTASRGSSRKMVQYRSTRMAVPAASIINASLIWILPWSTLGQQVR